MGQGRTEWGGGHSWQLVASGRDLGPSIEEHLDPHAHADEALGEEDDASAEAIDGDGLKKINRQIRLTLKDIRRFGFNLGCPRCLDLETGAFRTDRHHDDDCL